MNVAIARRLADISPTLRSIRLESCFVSALTDLPEGVVIRDIDVLFNPAYKVDVLWRFSAAHTASTISTLFGPVVSRTASFCTQ